MAPAVVAVMFFLSGAAALAYQVCWQRLLLLGTGADIESVTIVVSTFMMGLGVGAYAGGILADRFSGRELALFVGAEALLAAFGVQSIELVTLASDAMLGMSPAATALGSFLLLLVPTTCMGATLPLLVLHLNRIYHSIGVSVGTLYFVNTLGAAAGSLVTGFWAFEFATIDVVVAGAAGCNAVTAALGAALLLGARR